MRLHFLPTFPSPVNPDDEGYRAVARFYPAVLKALSLNPQSEVKALLDRTPFDDRGDRGAGNRA